MSRVFIKLTILFSSGCVGGIINSLVVWFLGARGVTAALGVKIAPDLTPTWLYPRIVWGGIWGFLFLLPFLKKSLFWRGFLFSLGPTIAQLFVVFPAKASSGMMGLGLGNLTPLFVLFFNAVWGVSTAIWLRLAKE
ncbi:MAG TPA: hypothetical protein VMW90_08485 [Acidobacteriota bacterium]|nr:hypothetical protein [Acidobacteriota bacterium]